MNRSPKKPAPRWVVTEYTCDFPDVRVTVKRDNRAWRIVYAGGFEAAQVIYLSADDAMLAVEKLFRENGNG